MIGVSRRPARAVALAAVIVALASAPAAGYVAGGRPLILSTYISSLSKRAAVLTAVIDPEGGETRYEFWLEYPPCSECEPIREPLHTGTIAFSRGHYSGGYGGDLVDYKLKKLKPDVPYRFWVVASNSSGSAESQNRPFEASTAGEERLQQERAGQEEDEVPLAIRPYLLERAMQKAAENGDPQPKVVEAVKTIIQSNEVPPESTVVYIVHMTGRFVCKSNLRGVECNRPGERPLKGKSMSLTFDAETLREIGFGFGKKKETLADRGLAVVLGTDIEIALRVMPTRPSRDSNDVVSNDSSRRCAV